MSKTPVASTKVGKGKTTSPNKKKDVIVPKEKKAKPVVEKKGYVVVDEKEFDIPVIEEEKFEEINEQGKDTIVESIAPEKVPEVETYFEPNAHRFRKRLIVK